MVQREIDGRTRETCPACQHIHYRNPVPAVGVVLPYDKGLVLVQRKFEPRAGYWSLPAGYMELGETTEEAAVRECREETGLDIQIDTLLGVYSFGQGAYSGFVIMYAASVIGGVPQAGDDACDIGIFTLEALPSSMAFYTHLQAIEQWHQQTKPKQTEPVRALGLQTQPLQGNSWHIRLAQDADAHQVLALLEDGRQYDNNQALMTAARFHSQVRDPKTPILIAEVGERIIGIVTLSFRPALTGRRASIDDLVVARSHRRRGLGQVLVEAAMQMARDHQCQMVQLDTTQSSELLSLSRACGFAENRIATMRIG